MSTTEVFLETGYNFEESEISIWMDKYNDVFSNFDIRPYTERSLSNDFLTEVQKLSSRKQRGEIKLKFYVLEDQRDQELENIIAASLGSHFKQITKELKTEHKQILRKGYLFLASGFALISFIFLLTLVPTGKEYMNGIILILEPVGWFTTWTGLDFIFQNSRKNKPAIDFNIKMAASKITFSSLGVAQESDSDSIVPKQKSVIPLDNNNLRVA